MLIIPTHFHCFSSCIQVKSQILDFGSKEVNFSTTCSSCLAYSGGLRAKGTQERGQTHTYKHNSICCFIWGGPQAGVTWSRTNCAKLALETHKNKKSTILPFPHNWFCSANDILRQQRPLSLVNTLTQRSLCIQLQNSAALCRKQKAWRYLFESWLSRTISL